MKKFNAGFLDIDNLIKMKIKPDFSNLLKVLARGKPSRLTLFETYLNEPLIERLTQSISYNKQDNYFNMYKAIDAFKIAGYDYTIIYGSDFSFKSNRKTNKDKSSYSLNDGAIITDRASYDRYKWPDPVTFDYSRFESLADYLPEGMRFIVFGPGGVLENTVELVGYENLCYMLADDRELVKEIIDAIGSRLVKYYEICAQYDTVGALISNDDWGFNTQTMLSTDDMHEYIIPWHKKIAETILASGKPAILHSCGMLDMVMDDIIDSIKYDAKHSYEDKICPVEKAYKTYNKRIAVLGGLDLDFICRSSPENVYNRAISMLELTDSCTAYALGSGNSIPYYVPQENYIAMIAAAIFNR